MKSRLLLIALFIPCFWANAQKYTMDLPKVIIKFSPQHILRSGLWLSGEIFDERHKMSNQISAEMLYKKANSFEQEEVTGVFETTGFTFEYMFRYFPGKLRIEKRLNSENVGGFYTGFFAQAGNYTDKVGFYNEPVWPDPAKYEATTVKTTGFYFGVLIGKQMSINEYMYVDMFLGAGLRAASSSLKAENKDFPWEELRNRSYRGIYQNGILPKAGLTFGIGFN